MAKFIGIILLIGAVFLILMLGKTPTLNQTSSKPSEIPVAPAITPEIKSVTPSPDQSIISEPERVYPVRNTISNGVYIGSAGVSGYSQQYFRVVLYIRLQKGETINITGWKIKSNKGEIIIPQAIEIYDPGGYTPQSDIILKPNNYIEIYGSASAINRNFRLNKCLGYLQETYKFEPPFYTNCPYFSSSEIRHLSGQCQSYIQSLGSCRTPDANSYNSWPGTNEGNACRAFLQNIGYGSCFRSHQGDADFLSNEWLVWLNQQQFLDFQHDYLRLYDKEGNLISEYNY